MTLGDPIPLGGRLIIDFPGATGYITLRNEGETGLRLTFVHDPRPDSTTTVVELAPREIAPVMGGQQIYRAHIESFCVHPGPYIHCARNDCDIPCCTHCGHHVEEAAA